LKSNVLKINDLRAALFMSWAQGGGGSNPLAPTNQQLRGIFLYSKQRFDPMPEFEQFIQERIYLQNVSPRTVDWYRQTFKWLEKYPLTEQGLKELVVGMRQAGLEATSCNNRIRCVNAFLKWAGLPLKVAKLKEDTKVMPTYTADQLKSIIDFRPKTPATNACTPLS
jgi:hypothetical protein